MALFKTTARRDAYFHMSITMFGDVTYCTVKSCFECGIFGSFVCSEKLRSIVDKYI